MIITDFDFPIIVFDIDPVPKPRMTIRDRWYTDPNHPNPKKRQRPIVTRYNEFKKNLLLLARRYGYKPSPILSIGFVIKMPDSWSRKKKMEMAGMPHQSRPDLDNLVKAFKDCLCTDDSFIYGYLNVYKVWGYNGQILVAEEVQNLKFKPTS